MSLSIHSLVLLPPPRPHQPCFLPACKSNNCFHNLFNLLWLPVATAHKPQLKAAWLSLSYAFSPALLTNAAGPSPSIPLVRPLALVGERRETED